MVNTKEILNILPPNIKSILDNERFNEGLQEVRLRVNKPLAFQFNNKEIIDGYICTSSDIKSIVQRISNYSIYAFEEELRQGYITIKGGHRIGICGSCVIEDGKIKTIKDIASLNIRISRAVNGCSGKLLPFILKNDIVMNTIIISPPKCGKTTILRDIARVLSNGLYEGKNQGKKVCIVDERSEIAGCCSGVPQMDVGMRTDVLDGCPKSEGIMMAIRSMSPDVIICDEIGAYKDMDSILMALNSGVSLVTSIHGFGIEDLYKRAVFKEILDNNVFKLAIVLSGAKGAGTIEYIYDFDKNEKVWRQNP